MAPKRRDYDIEDSHQELNYPSYDDPADREALVPKSYAVFGLTVHHQDEADTVRKVAMSSVGLAILMVIHFLVNWMHNGRLVHSLIHLLIVMCLPAVGAYAVNKRSPRVAWSFHAMATVFVTIHIISAAVMVQQIWKGDEIKLLVEICSEMAHDCHSNWANITKPGTFTADEKGWRCLDGYCIAAGQHCDGQIGQCYDMSDENDCSPTEAKLAKVLQKDNEWCVIQGEQDKVHLEHLMIWWIITTGPIVGLAFYAAYHSLEFYVQLRMSGLLARQSDGGTATVFERQDLEAEEDHAE